MSKSAVAVLLASTHLAASFVALSHDDHSTSVSLGQAAHADHGASHGAALAPPDGERWPTDAPLRTGMSNIQAAVEQFTAGEPASRERSGALARAIEENVGHIIEHCELPPKADAALHVVIGRMLTAANQLKTDASPDAAVAQLRSALQDYRDAFDHSAAVSSRQD